MRKKITILLREWADAELRTSAANPEAHLGYMAAKRIDEQEAQIAALQERVHLCAAYDELERENKALRAVVDRLESEKQTQWEEGLEYQSALRAELDDLNGVVAKMIARDGERKESECDERS